MHKIQHEINRLDKDWELARKELIIDNNGSEEEPNSRSAHTSSLLGFMILAFSIPFATSVEGMIIFAFGLISSIGLFIKAFDHDSKAAGFEKEKSSYEATKQKLKLELEELKIT